MLRLRCPRQSILARSNIERLAIFQKHMNARTAQFGRIFPFKAPASLGLTSCSIPFICPPYAYKSSLAPTADAKPKLTEKGRSRLGAVQSVGPAGSVDGSGTRSGVGLFAASSMADDGTAFTNGASAHNFAATRDPIRFELVRRDGKWDKQNRRSSGSAPPALTCQDLSRTQGSFLLKQKIQLEENTLLGYNFLGV